MRKLLGLLAVALALPAFSAELDQMQAATIYAMAHSVSGLPLPDVAPTVHVTTQAELCRLLKLEPKCGARGLTMQTGEVYVWDKLDFANPYDASALLHEFVHYLQVKSLGPATECNEWMRREKQAFAVQELVLRKADVDRYDILMVRHALSEYKCKE